MVVDDLDIVRSGLRPAKTNPPLSIDPNATAAGPLARERFQPIAG